MSVNLIIMGRRIRLALALITIAITPVLAQSPAGQPNLTMVISEILAKSDNSQKFIELYNLSDDAISLDGWKIQRTNSTGTKDWGATALVALDGVIQPRGYFLVASPSVMASADMSHNLTNLNSNEGNLRLADSGGFIHDLVGWGQASTKADGGAPIVKLDDTGQPLEFVAGESFKRRVNEDGKLIDSNHNLNDFLISAHPSPSSTPVPTVFESEDEPSNTSGSNSGGQVGGSTQNAPSQSINFSGPFAKLELSELFIDPDKPLTDAEDEFVEIYNPTNESVDLEGYSIQTGMKYSYKFTLPDIVIKSRQYLALFAIDTGLVLSNTEGQAQLLDPAGQTIYEASPYQKAKPNTSWAVIGGSWQWTAQSTPNAANIAVATGVGDNNGSRAASSRTYLSGGNTLGVDSSGRGVYEEPEVLANEQVDTAVVAGVGALALLYAGNEYRYDLANFFAKLRRYFASRRSGGAQT